MIIPVWSVAAALLFASSNAFAEPFMVLGKTIDLTPPAGYCALGNTSFEQQLFTTFKARTEAAGHLLQVAVPCNDLERAKAGTITQFPRSASVMVVKRRGQLTLDPRSRADFVKSLGSPTPIDVAVVNKRFRAALAGADFSGSLSAMTPLGSDGMAAYWSSLATVQLDGNAPQRVVSIIAAVLVNGLPLSVQVSEAAGATDGPAPASVAQQYVKVIVNRNDLQ